MAKTASSIEVNQLTRCFGAFRAVDDLSFTVYRGEIFGFLGANGAGKTTAIRMLTGLLMPTSGEAIVAGYRVTSDPEDVKRHIGYMSQKFSLYEDLTVSENHRFYGGIYGLTKKVIRERSERVLDNLGLMTLKDVRVGSLPPGIRQKVAFSTTILHQPDILFLDEPTSGVDPLTRRRFWEMIYDLADSGTTVFVTTHYMDEASYCDRVAILSSGRLAAMGTPAGLKSEYRVENMEDVFVTLAGGGGAG